MGKVFLEEKLSLTAENIDVAGERIRSLASKLKTEKRYLIELQYLTETLLLDSMNALGEGKSVTLKAYKTWAGQFLSIEIEGESFNPIKDNGIDDGYVSKLMDNISIVPTYTYTKEKINRVTMNIPKKKPGDIILSVGAIVLAVIAYGILSLFPKNVSNFVTDVILTPIGDTYISLISTCGVMMVFLSLIAGITGMNSLNQLKRTGSIVVKQIMFKNFLGGFLVAAIVPFFLGIVNGERTSEGSAFKQIIDLILGAVPSNVIEPFQTQNTLQIAFLAILLGIFLLAFKSKSQTVINFFSELNSIVIFIISKVCSVLPAYIFVAFLGLLVSGNVSIVANCWLIMVMVFVFMTLYAIVTKLMTRVKNKIPVATNIRNSIRIYLVGFITCSSMVCLDANKKLCLEKYKVNEDNLSFSIIIQQILYKVDVIIESLCFVYGLSLMYGLSFGIPGYIVMTISVILMSIVVPPVPGGGFAIMTSILIMAGLPSEAIAVFVSVEIFAQMISTAGKVFCVSDELVTIDSKIKSV